VKRVLEKCEAFVLALALALNAAAKQAPFGFPQHHPCHV
jgi:hypothetical protein